MLPETNMSGFVNECARLINMYRNPTIEELISYRAALLVLKGEEVTAEAIGAPAGCEIEVIR